MKNRLSRDEWRALEKTARRVHFAGFGQTKTEVQVKVLLCHLLVCNLDLVEMASRPIGDIQLISDVKNIFEKMDLVSETFDDGFWPDFAKRNQRNFLRRIFRR